MMSQVVVAIVIDGVWVLGVIVTIAAATTE